MWLKKMFKDSKSQSFHVMKLLPSAQPEPGSGPKRQGGTSRILEKCVSHGFVLLIEDQGEEVDPSIESIV